MHTPQTNLWRTLHRQTHGAHYTDEPMGLNLQTNPWNLVGESLQHTQTKIRIRMQDK